VPVRKNHLNANKLIGTNMKKPLLLLMILVLQPAGYSQEKSPAPKLSLLMFGDYFYNIEQVDARKKDLNGFQFRRIFLTADFALSESFDSRFRLESEQTQASLTPGGRLGFMLKDAFIKWKGIFQGSDFIFGLSPTPAFDVIEGAWGYRAVEKTIMDYSGVLATRDLGIDLKGRLNEAASINYWVKIGNNSVNSPEVNKYKRYYAQLHFIPFPNFQVAIYGDYASNAAIMDSVENTSKEHGIILGNVFLNFMQKDQYSIGTEFFYRSDRNSSRPNAGRPLETVNGIGISVFGWLRLTDLIRILARYDTIDPNIDRGNNNSNLLIGGIDFHINKNVSIIPNIESAFYQGVSSKDVVGRVTFSYQYQ
jgi:hypothetical protein